MQANILFYKRSTQDLTLETHLSIAEERIDNLPNKNYRAEDEIQDTNPQNLGWNTAKLTLRDAQTICKNDKKGWMPEILL